LISAYTALTPALKRSTTSDLDRPLKRQTLPTAAATLVTSDVPSYINVNLLELDNEEFKSTWNTPPFTTPTRPWTRKEEFLYGEFEQSEGDAFQQRKSSTALK